MSTAGPRASEDSAATSGVRTPRPTSGVNPAKPSHGEGTARLSPGATKEVGLDTTISESELVSATTYTAIAEDGKDRTELFLHGKVIVLGAELPAGAAVPAGKAGSGNLFTVRELLRTPAVAVSDNGELRVGVWPRGRAILPDTPPPASTGETGENAPTTAVSDGDVDEASAHATSGVAAPCPAPGQEGGGGAAFPLLRRGRGVPSGAWLRGGGEAVCGPH